MAASRLVRFEIAVVPGLSVSAEPQGVRAMLARLASHAMRQASDQVLVSASRRDGRVQIALSDDGVGTAAAVQQAALHDVAEWLASQGGSMSIEAVAGQGTTLLVRLPDPVAEGCGAEPTASHRPLGQRRNALAESSEMVTEESWDA